MVSSSLKQNKICPFLPKKLHNEPTLKLIVEEIPVVDEYTFLGIIFDKKLTFFSHLKYLKMKCNKTLQMLCVMAHKVWGADRNTLSSSSSSSSSSSCRAASTDIPDPLSPLFLIVHRLWQVFRATSRILTKLLYVCSSWSSCFCLAICWGPYEYITYELVSASPSSVLRV